MEVKLGGYLNSILMNAYAGSLKVTFRQGNLKFKYELPLTLESSFIYCVSGLEVYKNTCLFFST